MVKHKTKNSSYLTLKINWLFKQHTTGNGRALQQQTLKFETKSKLLNQNLYAYSDKSIEMNGKGQRSENTMKNYQRSAKEVYKALTWIQKSQLCQTQK